MFGRKKKTEVFMTNDLELYTTVHQALKAAQIPCEVKIVNTGTQNRRTGTLMAGWANGLSWKSSTISIRPGICGEGEVYD